MADRSVLIIDDDQTLVGALKEGLESLGFSVSAAFDGLQGILQAHQERPDAIMLDFNMPAGGGAGAYERLRNSVDTGKIPIIFLTGATIDEVKKEIRSSPNTFFLKKPVSVAQLRKVLDKIITGKKGGGPPPGSGADAGSAPLQKERYAQTGAASGGKTHELEFRVTYADTDRLGIVYYANYFKFFEQGRTELLRIMGLRYRDLEMERRIFMPVVKSQCEHIAPSRYDDMLRVRTRLSCLGPASVWFQNEIVNIDAPDKIVARGFTRHAMVNELWKPIRIPEDIKSKLAPYLLLD